jgi:hypothetical protein
VVLTITVLQLYTITDGCRRTFLNFMPDDSQQQQRIFQKNKPFLFEIFSREVA